MDGASFPDIAVDGPGGRTELLLNFMEAFMGAEPVLERIARVEGRVEEHSRMVDDIAGRFTNLEARFDRAEANNAARFDHLEARIDTRFDRLDAKIDGIRDGLDGRINGLDAKIDGIRSGLDGRIDGLDAKFNGLEIKIDGFRDGLDSKMTSYFTWMIGLTMASWLSLMYQISHFAR
jgi:hypothetical protein